MILYEREKERERGFLFDTVIQLLIIHCLHQLNLLAQIDILHQVKEQLHVRNIYVLCQILPISYPNIIKMKVLFQSMEYYGENEKIRTLPPYKI